MNRTRFTEGQIIRILQGAQADAKADDMARRRNITVRPHS